MKQKPKYTYRYLIDIREEATKEGQCNQTKGRHEADSLDEIDETVEKNPLEVKGFFERRFDEK